MTGASITVRNSGGYVAKFSVTYTKDGHRHTEESGQFSLGVNKTVGVPDGATDIHLKVEEYWFISSTTTIFTKSFDAPVTKYYKVWGTTLNPSWCETDAHFDCVKHSSPGGMGRLSCAAATAPAAIAFAAQADDAVHARGEGAAPAAATPVSPEAMFAAAGGNGIEGCIALFAGLSLCYDLQTSPPSVDLSLQFAGIKLAQLELSAAKPCATLKGDYGLVSWDLELCLNLAQRTVTL